MSIPSRSNPGGTPSPYPGARAIGRFGASLCVQVQKSWALKVSGMRAPTASLLTCGYRIATVTAGVGRR